MPAQRPSDREIGWPPGPPFAGLAPRWVGGSVGRPVSTVGRPVSRPVGRSVGLPWYHGCGRRVAAPPPSRCSAAFPLLRRLAAFPLLRCLPAHSKGGREAKVRAAAGGIPEGRGGFCAPPLGTEQWRRRNCHQRWIQRQRCRQR